MHRDRRPVGRSGPSIRRGPRAPIAWLVALLALPSLVSAGAAARRAKAQPAEAWVLDQFEVRHTVDVHGEVETKRYLTHGGNIDEFRWGGTKVYTGTYPTGQLIVTGTLKIELPDKITPGSPFTIGGGATGTINTPGRTGQTAGMLVALAECYDRPVCSGKQKAQYIDDIEGKTVSFAAPLEPQTATLPTDPAGWPPSFVVHFRGTFGTTTPGDPTWRIHVYAHYQRPEIVPTPVPSYRLEVDADATRLPPSGAAPSEAAITATMTDGTGKPVAGEALRFMLDPPDMGQLVGSGGTTDAAGEVRVRFRAPTVAALQGRDGVAVVVTNAARSLERRLNLRIERYQLRLTVDPTDIPIEPVWRAIKVTAEVRDFDGKPVAGDVLTFRVDPPDLGTVIGAGLTNQRGPTDAGGRVAGFYEPPPPSELRGREQATIYVENTTHGGEQGAGVRFLGLKVLRSWPKADARDVQLEPGDSVEIEFDRPIDPASVTADSVSLTTVAHGDLGVQPTSFGRSISLKLTADPIPDVGLMVHVHVAGGQDGVKARDGAVMSAPYDLYFRTLPRMEPRIIVSQVVDNPRDPLYGVIALALKPYVVRVEGGLSDDTELDDERVSVRLLVPRRNQDDSVEHTFYPGRWPPKVPDAAMRKGNTANFLIPMPFGRGGYIYDAEVRPLEADPEKVYKAPRVEANVNSWSDPAAARKIGLMALPLVNEHIPGYAWNASRGQQEQWLLGTAQPAANLLPLSRLDLRLGYLSDTTCIDPDKCGRFDTSPVSSFAYWVRDIGRAGFMTRLFGWRYIAALVPTNYFDRFADHPDVLAHPELYHDAIQNGIWSQTARGLDSADRSSVFPISLVEVGVPAEAIVHVIGDIHGLADSSAARDRLSGYDVLNDRAIYADDERSIGADHAVMNLGVGFGATWPATHDYEALLDNWTERSCLGAPPCPPRFAAAAGARPGRDAARTPMGDAARAAGMSARRAAGPADPVPALLVSGTIRRPATGAEAADIEPLIRAPGEPTLDASDQGDYTLHLRTADGGEIARYRFSPSFDPLPDGALASFIVVVPDVPTATAVTITRGDGGPAIGQVARSGHAPTVRFSRPAPGATARGDVDVAWTGDDADGDPLRYTLLLSSNGGRSWEPLLTDSARTSFTLSSDLVGNGPDVRLRVVALDGFDGGEATVAIGLDNPLTVRAVDPADGARDVAQRTIVQAWPRDGLDPSTVDGAALTIVPVVGAGAAGGATEVPGAVGYDPVDGSVVFTPTLELAAATTYEARLSARIRASDGRRLAGDRVWTFTTRGRTVFLPWAVRSGSTAQRTATPRPPRTPAAPPTLPPTPAVTPTPPGPIASATATPDVVGTRVAATLTALAPSPTRAATSTASPTPDDIGTRVASTLTALAPTPGGAPSATPTPGQGAGAVTALRAATTGTEPTRLRMAFAPGEAITLWIEIANDGAAPATVRFAFAVRDDAGAAMPELTWSGALEAPAGTSWTRLERTIPVGAAPGERTFTGAVTVGDRTTEVSSQLYIARALRLAEDFSDPASGWPSGQDASGSYGYVDGEYRFLHSRADIWRWATLPGGPSLTDVAVEGDVRMPGTAQGWVALVFGLTASNEDFHIFEIDRAGQYSVWRRAAGAWEGIIPPTSSDQLAVADAVNHLLLVRRSGLTTLYANGQLISLVTDIAAPAGRIGIYASNGDAGFEGRWDNVRAYAAR